MDGLYNGKPYEQMDDLGGKLPLFLVQHPYAVRLHPAFSPQKNGGKIFKALRLFCLCVYLFDDWKESQEGDSRT